MSAITPAAYSTEMTTLLVNKQYLTSPQVGGQVKVCPFTFTNGAADLAATSVIILTKLPKNAIILSLRVDSNNDTATSTLAVGFVPVSTLDNTNVAALIAATAAASGTASLSLAANAVLTQLSAESYLTATVGTAAHAATKVIKGFVTYVDNAS